MSFLPKIYLVNKIPKDAFVGLKEGYTRVGSCTYWPVLKKGRICILKRGWKRYLTIPYTLFHEMLHWIGYRFTKSKKIHIWIDIYF